MTNYLRYSRAGAHIGKIVGVVPGGTGDMPWVLGWWLPLCAANTPQRCCRRSCVWLSFLLLFRVQKRKLIL